MILVDNSPKPVITTTFGDNPQTVGGHFPDCCIFHLIIRGMSVLFDGITENPVYSVNYSDGRSIATNAVPSPDGATASP